MTNLDFLQALELNGILEGLKYLENIPDDIKASIDELVASPERICEMLKKIEENQDALLGNEVENALKPFKFLQENASSRNIMGEIERYANEMQVKTISYFLRFAPVYLDFTNLDSSEELVSNAIVNLFDPQVKLDPELTRQRKAFFSFIMGHPSLKECIARNATLPFIRNTCALYPNQLSTVLQDSILINPLKEKGIYNQWCSQLLGDHCRCIKDARFFLKNEDFSDPNERKALIEKIYINYIDTLADDDEEDILRRISILFTPEIELEASIAPKSPQIELARAKGRHEFFPFIMNNTALREKLVNQLGHNFISNLCFFYPKHCSIILQDSVINTYLKKQNNYIDFCCEVLGNYCSNISEAQFFLNDRAVFNPFKKEALSEQIYSNFIAKNMPMDKRSAVPSLLTYSLFAAAELDRENTMSHHFSDEIDTVRKGLEN